MPRATEDGLALGGPGACIHRHQCPSGEGLETGSVDAELEFGAAKADLPLQANEF